MISPWVQLSVQPSATSISTLKNKIFSNLKKSSIYLRYVDDILLLDKKKRKEEICKLQKQVPSLSLHLNLILITKFPFSIYWLTPIIINSPSPHLKKKQTTSINSCTLNYKSKCPNYYKIAIIKNLINCAKINSSTKQIFYIKLKNIKQSSIITSPSTSLTSK